MMQKNVLLNVQKEKIKQTEVQMIEWMGVKEGFLKKHIPIQQRIIKNLDNAAQITMLKMRQISSVLKQQRQTQLIMMQRLQKSVLYDEKRFGDNILAHSSKQSSVKRSSSQQSQVSTLVQNQVQWAGDIEKIMNCMSNSSKKRLMDCKEFIKNIEKCEDELVREETKYQNEVKKCVKAVEKLLEKIDGYEKEQDSIVTNITKPSKNKDRDGNFYLIEYKKLENQFKMLFGALADRGKEIFGLMKVILDSEKGCLKKLKEVLEVYQKGKNTLCRENQFDERLLGALVVVEDSIAESRKQYFNRYLLSEDQIQVVKTLVQQPNMNGSTPNLQCVVRYLKLQSQDFLTKLNAKNKLQYFSSNLCYKKWPKTFLAQGWLITSYTGTTIYLTYDNSLSIIKNETNELIKKVNLTSTKINKLGENNVIFLQETIKGFFTDSKEEYQIKFSDYDHMEEFIVFIQNKAV